MNWRDKVDPAIKTHLEKQVAETVKERRAYEYAQDSGNAQLWVAVANLSRQIFDLELRIKSLEKVSTESLPKKTSKKKIKKAIDKQ